MQICKYEYEHKDVHKFICIYAYTYINCIHLYSYIRDDIFQSEIISRRKFKSSQELQDHMISINEIYAKRSDEEWEKILIGNKVFKTTSKTFHDALKKARANNWFLGLDSNWMHEP